MELKLYIFSHYDDTYVVIAESQEEAIDLLVLEWRLQTRENFEGMGIEEFELEKGCKY